MKSLPTDDVSLNIHYQLHWEFFKSTNPQATELFFIKLQIDKLTKRIKKEKKDIDFANDSTGTLDHHLRDQKKQGFFFHFHYKKFLKTRLEQQKTVENLLNKNQLPKYDKVFFVHYQCDNFNEGEQIFNLCIYSDRKAKIFQGNEAESILQYAEKINELLNNGLVLVHWNQDRPNYGIDHIKKRYKDLSGESLNLSYRNEINLAEWLIFEYGQDYISHPRLDSLAQLNNFRGIRETEHTQQTFASNRLLLLTKIYFNAYNGTLKTETSTAETAPGKPQRKHTTKAHVISFILDCYATGETLPIGNKTKIEKIAKQRPQYTGSANTFYKNFNEISNPKNLKKEDVLISLIGDNWRNIILQLSKAPKTLKAYLDLLFV